MKRKQYLQTYHEKYYKWPVDKVRYDYDQRLCVECNATGKIEKLPCPFCEGQKTLPKVIESKDDSVNTIVKID